MDKLSVTQADRDAVVAFFKDRLSEGACKLIRAGKLDWDPRVQAFAAHRIASQAELREALSRQTKAVAAYITDYLLDEIEMPEAVGIDAKQHALLTAMDEANNEALATLSHTKGESK